MPDPDSSISALDLVARAAELAPQSAGIGWLHLQLCAQTPACDIRDVATVMRWVDADNGAAWLPTLAAAQKDKDTRKSIACSPTWRRDHASIFIRTEIVVLMFDALKTSRHELPGGYADSDSARFSRSQRHRERARSFRPSRR